MPYQIAEQLRRLALRCQRLATNSNAKEQADELEGVSAELAEIAQILDTLFDHV